MSVKIEIICIGNELLIGKIQNTNAQWLAKQATQMGAEVKRITIIKDIIDEIAATIKEVKARNPCIIITTGGLGPTFDDKTLQGIGRALNRKLEVNPVALQMVRQGCIEYAKKIGKQTDIELTPPRIKMATFPAGTYPISNPIGTAPGLQADFGDTSLFVLPGVPIEMEAIFTQTIAPLIRKEVGHSIFCQKSLFVENIVESRLAPLIDKVMAQNEGVYIKSHPMPAIVELHLTITNDYENTPADILLKACKEITYLININGGRVIAEN